MPATSYRRKGRSRVDSLLLLATTATKGCSPAPDYKHKDATCAVVPTPHPRRHPPGPRHPPAGSRRPSHRRTRWSPHCLLWSRQRPAPSATAMCACQLRAFLFGKTIPYSSVSRAVSTRFSTGTIQNRSSTDSRLRLCTTRAPESHARRPKVHGLVRLCTNQLQVHAWRAVVW